MARKKPRPQPRELTMDSREVKLVDVGDGDAEHGAVCGDERQVDAQRRVQRRDVLFQHDFYQLHQGGDDQDEDDGLLIAQARSGSSR